MTATSREVDGYTHLALSVLYALYDKGWGKNYPHEIADIMQRILDLDRKAYKAEIEGEQK
jgi:hypothetical protein